MAFYKREQCYIRVSRTIDYDNISDCHLSIHSQTFVNASSLGLSIVTQEQLWSGSCSMEIEAVD